MDEGTASILARGAAGAQGPASTGGPASPGDTLRVARQLAGLSQEDIAGKLKLSPRQIAAIETGDWSALPERTFTRGFMRNYARLVGVDPETLGLDQSPTQSANQLKPTPAAIGEIVQEADRNGFSAARWVVPALLIAALVAGVLYFQGQSWFGWDPAKIFSTGATPSLKSAVAAKAELAEKTEPAGLAPTATPGPAASSGAVIAPATVAMSPGITAVPAAPLPDASAAAPAVALAPTVATGTLAPQPSAALVPAAGEKRISLIFKGKSWTEVRSKGDVIFSETATPGTREFNGAVPLSFTVGNASNVVVTIDGKTFDMTELTRNDVARFRVE